MKRIIIIAIATAIATLNTFTLAAQTSYGGVVLDHDIMMPADFANLSQTQVFGTSRSMAMGGAFTSLGADISSTSINPAGLGMFAHEELSFTPMVSIASASTPSTSNWSGNRRSNFGFSNMGGSFNLVENASGALITLNGAITYNRLSDYNSKVSLSTTTSYSSDLVPTIADIFGSQLAGAGIYPSSDESMDYDNNPYYWPAQLAYKCYMLDPTSGNGGWTTNTIGYNASVGSSLEILQRGRTDEYSFAVGGNIANMLYFGATLSIQDVTQVAEYLYQEEYSYSGGYALDSEGKTLDYQLANSALWQQTQLMGSGCNIKLGLVIRPVRTIRLGVAYHSPTYYSLARSYSAAMQTTVLGNSSDAIDTESFYASTPEFIDDYEYSWRFSSPAKFLTGASLQVANFAIVSADYQRVWYNNMKVTNAPGELTEADYRSSFEEYYQPSNTIRLGVEFKPLPTIAVRGGGGYTSSIIKDESEFYSSPVATDSKYFTIGLGAQLSSRTTLDLAYQNHTQNYTPYTLFFSENSDGDYWGSNQYNTTIKSSYIMVTCTIRM